MLPLRNITSWMSPRSKHWHLLDFIIVRQSDKSDVSITKAIPVSTTWSDHRLLLSKLSIKLRLQHKKSSSSVPKKLNVSHLNLVEKQAILKQSIINSLENIPIHQRNSVETYWESFKDSVYNTSAEVLGFTRRSHQDWFDENDKEIQPLLDSLHSAHKQWMNFKTSSSLKESYLRIKREVQKKLRAMKNAWWENISVQLQAAADLKDSKSFHRILKTVYGPKSNSTSPVFDSDGKTLLTDKSEVLDRWKRHFEDLLNRDSTVDDSVIDSVPQRAEVEELSLEPSIDEIRKAIGQLVSGKAPGNDGIPAEIFKFGGDDLIEKLHELFILIWETGRVPQDFKDASIIHLYKNKGPRKICDNHRGISLLSVVGKILARVILNRIITHIVPSVYQESQCGFRSGKGTVDMIFALRQIQEKSREQNNDLYMVFIDLTKAFDTVNREALWKVLRKLGIPENMLNVICSFHDGMQASVRVGGESSSSFNVTNGTKQGCVMAPVLFALFFSVMLVHAFEHCDKGISIQFRSSGGLFNQKRLNARTKLSYDLIRELLFADDCALVANSLADIQDLVNRFSIASKAFGLTISLKKTEVLFQPKPNTPHVDPLVNIDDYPLKSVKSFTYLGSTVNSNATLDNELSLRIAKASAAFGRLRHRLWKDRGVRLKTKIDVYHSVVIPTLLYASETWTLYRKQIKMLDSFHMRCLRSILGVSWQDRMPNNVVLAKCFSTGIEHMLIKSQLRWIGHVVRMSDDRIPKYLLYGQCSSGSRKVGRPLLRYKDKIKANIKTLGLPEDWESLCKDRAAWRTNCFNLLKTFEKRRQDHRTLLRQRRNLSSPNVPCDQCNFKARSNAGLAVHKRFKHA